MYASRPDHLVYSYLIILIVTGEEQRYLAMLGLI